MKDISIHINKTENLLNKYKNELKKELASCENELVSYEIRESILKLERKENRFLKLKVKLLKEYKEKDSESLKRIYKSLKRSLGIN